MSSGHHAQRQPTGKRAPVRFTPPIPIDCPACGCNVGRCYTAQTQQQALDTHRRTECPVSVALPA